MREEGFGALYKGFVPKVLRLAPGGGVLLLVVEFTLGVFRTGMLSFFSLCVFGIMILIMILPLLPSLSLSLSLSLCELVFSSWTTVYLSTRSFWVGWFFGGMRKRIGMDRMIII